MKNINEFLAIVHLCDDNELETLTSYCNKLLEERRTAARNALRKELMTNLQQAISAILDNDFNLVISNTDRNNPYDRCVKVRFIPADHFSIEIE